jgi:signal peptide peptidase SppA
MASPARGRTKARRLLNSVLSTPWAVKRDWLQEFAGLAEEARIRGDDLSAGELRERLRAALASLGRDAEAPAAVAIDHGQPLGEGLRATARDGVAIIPVIGPLYHYASEFDDVCGCSSYEQIARDFSAALESQAVGAILFEVDSPGGEVAGCGELAQMIYAARERKPTRAFVSNLGCSGGYWLASAAEEVVIAKAAIVGSIGVVMSFVDTSERDAKAGVRRFEILSSQSPNKRVDPNEDAGRAQIQQLLDDLASVFIEDVAAFRGVPVETVLSDFGQGGVMVGARAVSAGLADRIGSFEGVLAELAEGTTASSRGTPAPGGIRSTLSQEPTMAKENETATPAAETQPASPTPVTAESISKAHPEIVAEIRTAAATAERDRILGIEELALKGQEALVAECKADAACTPEAFAVRQTQAIRASGAAEGEGRQRHLRAIAGDEAALNAPAPSTEGGGDSEEALARSIAQAGQLPAVTR